VANLAQFDVGAKQREAQIQALLEDLTEFYVGQGHLALAVWWGVKRYGLQEQHLLYLYSGIPLNGIASEDVPLYWKSGSQGPPFVRLEATDVGWFSTLMKADPQRVVQYRDGDDYKVLHFDKQLLTPDILKQFRVITEPSGLMKGWYVDQDEYAKDTKPRNVGELLAIHRTSRPHLGLVKTEEKDFENCRGLLHIESSQLWVPMLPDGLQSYRYYTDWQQGRHVYFLFEGGALYQVLQFDFKTEHDYASRFGLLKETPNVRYSGVYLRAVRPPAQPAA
jgi:hypothetical protein